MCPFSKIFKKVLYHSTLRYCTVYSICIYEYTLKMHDKRTAPRSLFYNYLPLNNSIRDKNTGEDSPTVPVL